jgi:hypothetical protein
VAAVWPKWRSRQQGRNFLRVIGSQATIAELIGAAPAVPWTNLSTPLADAIMLPNLASSEGWARLTGSSDVVHVTGVPSDDAIASALAGRGHLREMLFAAAGRQTDVILACAWPADHTSKLPSLEGFVDYDAICRRWGETLCRLRDQYGVLPVISFHPKHDGNGILKLVGGNILVSPFDFPTLAPASDLFVASMSNTIYKALALGLPVVNYDIYGKTHYAFPGARGYAEVQDAAAFDAAIDAAVSQLRARPSSATGEARDSRWALVDGGNCGRIENALRQLWRVEPATRMTASPP